MSAPKRTRKRPHATPPNKFATVVTYPWLCHDGLVGEADVFEESHVDDEGEEETPPPLSHEGGSSPGGPDLASGPRLPRRWRIGALLLVTAVVVGGVLVVRGLYSYSPFNQGSLSVVSTGSFAGNPLTFEDFRDVSPLISPDEVHIRFRPGGRFVVGFSVNNAGRWGVKVEAVPVQNDGLVRATGVRMGPKNNFVGSPLPSEMVPFRPFRLGDGDERFVQVEYALADCAPELPDVRWAEGSGPAFGWTEQRVDFEVFGISRHMNIELPWAVAVLYSAEGMEPGCGNPNRR